MSEAIREKYERRCRAQDYLCSLLKKFEYYSDLLYLKLPDTMVFDEVDGAVVNHRRRLLYDDLCCVRFNVNFLVQWLE